MEKYDYLFREYDDAAARAGALVGCRSPSYTPDILKRTESAIFGTVAGNDRPEQPIRWNPNGMVNIAMNGPHDLVILPFGTCQGRPVWPGDILLDSAGRSVEFVGLWSGFDFTHHTWPIKWPTTTLTKKDLMGMAEAIIKRTPQGTEGAGYVELANMIIAHECAAGNLVPGKRGR